MPFAIVAIPHAAYRDLPTPQHRWLLLCLARYADRAGVCWPSIRQLAADSRMSPATVCRYLKSMDALGVFHRERQGVGRYHYTLAEAYVPRWKPRVSRATIRVSQQGTEKENPRKHDKKEDRSGVFQSFHADAYSPWEPRMRAWAKSRFWLPMWGPNPAEPGCFIPAALLQNGDMIAV